MKISLLILVLLTAGCRTTNQWKLQCVPYGGSGNGQEFIFTSNKLFCCSQFKNSMYCWDTEKWYKVRK